ncbi:MAG TPA: YncE family protein [Salinivirgaceae bacterium]|nr:YncE family protein [Salinivirgaceae bacterium]
MKSILGKAIVSTASILCFVLISCIKEPDAPTNSIPNLQTRALLILNEGLFQMNNSSLTYFSFSDSTSITDFFEIQNGRKLGDTGNHMACYGNKIYIVVNVSSRIEVIDKKNGQGLVSIPMFNGSQPRQPRYIAFYQNKAYVCSFDGTVSVIDTSTLAIQNIIRVGQNPDGIIVANEKIYVANSGGLNYPNYDRTISVIDPQTEQETKRIEVQINPHHMAVDRYGDLYVISRGNYTTIKSCLQRIDTQTDSLVETFQNLEAQNIAILNDTAYLYQYNFSGQQATKLILFNVKTEQIINDNFANISAFVETPYGITVDPVNRQIFLTDARGFTNRGKVVCLSKIGEKLFEFQAGINPNHIVLITQ